jgi:hypothetical protein
MVVKNYVTQDGLTLGAWIQTQRRIYNGSEALQAI